MQIAAFVTPIGFLCSLRFIREKTTENEAAGYTAIKAMNAVQFIQSRLLDLKETGNTIADVALAKLDAVLEKNEGLRRVVRFANGKSISEAVDKSFRIRTMYISGCGEIFFRAQRFRVRQTEYT